MTVGIYWIFQHSRDRAIYVGLSKRLEYRAKEHRSKLVKNKHLNPRLQATWNKYGAEDFTIALLEETPLEKLVEREQFWCDALSPTCNIAVSSENFMLGRHHTEETKAKMRATKLGKKHTIEERANMSKAHLGQRPTDEVRIRRSAAIAKYYQTDEARKMRSEYGKEMWRIGKNKGRTGMKSSAETVKKRADSNRGKKRTEEQKQHIKDGWAKRRERIKNENNNPE